MTPLLTASLVLYHDDPALVQTTIDSFLATNLPVKLFISDNSRASQRQSITLDGRCQYTHNERNLGFAIAHNRRIVTAMPTSRYHLVLNPDIRIPAGTLENLCRFMDDHLDVGLVMPQVLDFDGNEKYLCKRLPTPVDLIVRRFGSRWLDKIFNNRLRRYEMRDKNYNSSFTAPFLSGCFMFLRTEALEKTGLFDERFFLYMEDLDLCRRLYRHFKTVYFPDVHIYHGHARRSYKEARLLFIHVKSAIRYFNKWGWFSDAERRRINRRV